MTQPLGLIGADPAHLPTIAELTPALLSAISGALISLTFRYVPGARTWFDQLDGERKQLLMFVVTTAVALIIGGISLAQEGVSEESLITLGLSLYAALTSNQSMYQFIKTAKSLR